MDIVFRTPLWYAVSEENVEVVRLLLFKKANPWSYKGCDYQASTSNPVI